MKSKINELVDFVERLNTPGLLISSRSNTDLDLSEGDNSPKPKIDNVGEEFMKWAEQHWALETLISRGFKNGEESCQYSAMREIFIQKINELSNNIII